MGYELTYKPFGEHSILIEWPSIIDKDILLDIISFKEIIKKNNIKVVIEVRISYNSLLVIYELNEFVLESSVQELKNIYASFREQIKPIFRQWKIPVCYDDQFAIDLDEMSLEKNMSKSDIIKRHSSAIYTVYFIGFLPGFLYLGGLDKTLYTPRKATPRLKIEKGTVAIGGKQTGVYPSESPGGWNIIGNSPIEFFNAQSEIPCFAKSGDRIKFNSVSLKEYQNIKSLVEAGVYQLESEMIYD
ncbi:5-oxoprolinase subunit PxpB [uncultured Algibacter sp.]|uniref:5-oxoprolinase subunit PxpB n=1 Tax=uncultured Algibacter sp. TaxID=298659 RepID=UPI002627235B|nr:5-oxoprolinase subunit PxpB [uncultured Algibacter sp.]